MSLVNVNELLEHATKHGYGVAAINTINYETIRCAIDAAEQERVPVIVQFFPGFDRYIPLSYISYMAKDLAKKAGVPVAVHLDHSASYEIAVSGIRDGFPSVMVDGSALPFEENIAVTAAVVKTASVFGVDVEAELGHVGNETVYEEALMNYRYTDPDQAAEFVQRTGCDSLAVAIGNQHGVYTSKPKLNFEVIRRVQEAVSVPLVLHGASGIGDEDIRRAISLGIAKINIHTELCQAAMNAIHTNGNQPFLAVERAVREGIKQRALEKIRLFGADGKAG